MKLLLIAAFVTACLIICVCAILSIGPQERIKKKSASKRPINRLHECDDYCDEGIKYCCKSCAHAPTCMLACEDYDGDCNVRKAVY